VEKHIPFYCEEDSVSVEQAFNYRKMSEAICTSGLLSETQISALRDEGYECVINLLPNDSEYALTGEKELVEEQGLLYTYIPVDFSAPHKSDYLKFEESMKALHGSRLMVHCAANYRVSAFYAIYAYKHLGWSAAEAHEHIASVWNPAEHHPWHLFIAEHLEGTHD
jgi:protein tyrosine phosphatase (PTP) superfamily phosphohydrolase (DUF442 family)